MHEVTTDFEKDFILHDAGNCTTLESFIRARIEGGHETGSFAVCNFSPIISQFRNWKRELPMVEPYYAVKCNPDPPILRLLSSLGCKFDCATMGEMELVINGLGDEVSLSKKGNVSEHIVYANPAKMENMLRYAVAHGVRMTVFDGEDELIKLANIGGKSAFDLLLLITTDDRASICSFSKKFGCPVNKAPKLLQLAKELGMNVVGVSFHVGSGCGDTRAYATAISDARAVFLAAEDLGMPPLTVVDIGGGFPGDEGGYGGPGMPTFTELAQTIRASIEEFQVGLNRPQNNVRFVAEPGRFFVSASTAVATKVYARRGGLGDYQALYVDDGIYGSFNNVIYDHATPVPKRLTLSKRKACIDSMAPTSAGAVQAEESSLTREHETATLSESEPSEDVSDLLTSSSSTSASMDENHPQAPPALIPTAVFGPTCDGLDQMCTLDSTTLPRCEIGDWLLWENMGAYTHTASFVFNGYTHIPNRTYCFVSQTYCLV